MTPRVLIDSYFSLETDLADALASLPELVSGEGYDVVLVSADGSQRVETRWIPGSDDRHPQVEVTATDNSALFQRVLGIVTLALAAHSDSLQITRRDGP